jgi:hypothetical protein
MMPLSASDAAEAAESAARCSSMLREETPSGRRKERARMGSTLDAEPAVRVAPSSGGDGDRGLARAAC